MTSDLIGINSNFGDTATISGSCGTTKAVCKEYKGVNKGNGESQKLTTTDKCFGAQGQLAKLPTCDGAAPAPTKVVTTLITSTKKATSTKKTTTKKVTTTTKK
jgi:hypothetical protein